MQTAHGYIRVPLGQSACTVWIRLLRAVGSLLILCLYAKALCLQNHSKAAYERAALLSTLTHDQTYSW